MNKTLTIRDLADEITHAQCELLNAKVILNCWLTEYGGNNVSIETFQATGNHNTDHLNALLWVVKYEEIERLVSIAQDYVVRTSKMLDEIGTHAQDLHFGKVS